MSSTTETKKRICIIGCGPAGLSALYHFSKLSDDDIPELVCYEKQDTWGGLWNRTWRTGTDQYGEHLHSSMYYDMWVNDPKEVFEYDDYTYEEHFGKLIPSYVTLPVIRDYLEGRFTRASQRDLKQFIKFSTIVNRVDYIKDMDDFKVRVKHLPTDTESEERFTHIIVASGTFSHSNVPHVPGLDQFKGRVLHSQDVKHMEEFKGQRILLIGARWSAEDLALQAHKFGAKSVVISWRTAPHGQDWFEFPGTITQHPLVVKFINNTACFKDGFKAEFDMVIFCTGYKWHYPFMADDLRLREQFTGVSKDFYKATLWLNGGNGKVLYFGAPYSIYTFCMFEAQAIWSRKYIMGDIKVPSQEEMVADSEKWVQKLSEVNFTKFINVVDFMTQAQEDLCIASGYTTNCLKGFEILQAWGEHKAENILTFRDQQYRSVYTGKLAPRHHTTWMEAFDDSLESFGLKPFTS